MESQQANQETAVPIPLTKSDIQNLIAFGNRSQMSGQEAEIWVELKHRLAQAYDAAVNADEERRLKPVPDGDDAA